MTLYRIFRDERGFTLIELVIILILIGLLAGIAIPRYVNLTRQAREASAKALLESARAAATLAFASDVAGGAPHSLQEADGGDITRTLEPLLDRTPRYPSGFGWDWEGDGTSNGPANISAILDGDDVNTL